MLRRTIGTTLAAIGAVLAMLTVTGAPASADSFYTGGTANSIWNFTIGSTTYYQNHGGDDFAFDVTSGIATDMRWQKCSDSSVIGSIMYNITPSGGYRVLGTDFLAGTCLRIQFRGYTSTGAFNGYTYWNYNFA